MSAILSSRWATICKNTRAWVNRMVWRLAAVVFALWSGYDIRTAWYISMIFLEFPDGEYFAGASPREAVLTELSYQ